MKANYEFIATQLIDKDETYKHILVDKTLFIQKDGKIIAELDDADIMSMLGALGIGTSDFKKGFWK